LELRDVIKYRRSVREYTDALVDQGTIKSIIEVAAFAVELNRARIDEYGKQAKIWSLANFSQSGLPPDIREKLEDPEFALFYHAPALVIVMATSSEIQAEEDCCLVAENLMLAARDKGLGTCWIGSARPWLDLPSTKDKLNLPDHLKAVAPIVIGYPKAWPEFHGPIPAEIYWLGL